MTAEDLGGATLHCSTSGVTDHFAQDELHATAIARSIISNLGGRHAAAPQQQAGGSWDEPLHPSEELRGLAPLDPRAPYDPRALLSRILDGSRFEEFKSNYGKTLVTGGWVRWHGYWCCEGPCCREDNLMCNSRLQALARCTASPWVSWPTTGSCSARRPSREPTSFSCAASEGSRCSSCRTSPASWSDARRKREALQRTGPRWSWPWQMQRWEEVVLDTPHSLTCLPHCQGAQGHARRWRIVRSRKLWHVWASILPRLSVHVAQRQDRSHGRGAGGGRPGSGELCLDILAMRDSQ